MNQAIGYLILSIPFIAIFSFLTYVESLKVASVIFIATSVVLASVWLGGALVGGSIILF